MEKHSAYKSMKTKNNKTTPEARADLIRWTNEKWLNLTAKITDNKKLPCGTKGKKQKEMGLPSVCRPSIKISDKTPKLSSNYTNQQIINAINIKSQGKTVKWADLSNIPKPKKEKIVKKK
jgi:hypothetical protein